MSGEKITASSIHRNISEDLNSAHPSPKNERTASVFSELLYVLGRVLLFCIKAFVLIVGGILALSIIAAVVAVISFLIGGSIVGMPFHIAGTQSVLLVILLLLVFVLPVFIVIYLLMKLVFDLPSQENDPVRAVRYLDPDPDLYRRIRRKELRPLGRSGAKRQHRTLFSM